VYRLCICLVLWPSHGVADFRHICNSFYRVRVRGRIRLIFGRHSVRVSTESPIVLTERQDHWSKRNLRKHLEIMGTPNLSTPFYSLFVLFMYLFWEIWGSYCGEYEYCHVVCGVCDYRRDMDWWMDLLTTYTPHSELQEIIALSLIFTLYKSLHGKSPPVCSVFTSRSVATASNNGDSSTSRPQVRSSQPPIQNRIHCQLKLLRHLFWASLAKLNCQLTGSSQLSSLWPLCTNRVENSSTIVECVFFAAGTFLPIRCLETGCITPLFIRLFRGNGCRRYNIWGQVYPEDGSGIFLWNVGEHLQVFTASHQRR
jgi:hypothetical protein